MKDDEIIAVVQAHKAGKIIEASFIVCNSWTTLEEGFLWDFIRVKYRVKAEEK